MQLLQSFLRILGSKNIQSSAEHPQVLVQLKDWQTAIERVYAAEWLTDDMMD